MGLGPCAVVWSVLTPVLVVFASFAALEAGMDCPLYLAHLSVGVFFGHLTGPDRRPEFLSGFPDVGLGPCAVVWSVFTPALVVFASVAALESRMDCPLYFAHLPLGVFL